MLFPSSAVKQGVNFNFLSICVSVFISPYGQNNTLTPSFVAEDMQAILVPGVYYSFEDKMGQKIQFCP